MVTYLGSLVQLCCGGGGHCKQISLACAGSARSVLTTLDLPQLTVPVLSQSTPLRLQVALQGNCSNQAMGFVHFPGLSCSGSGSRVLHKALTQLVMSFVPFPGPSSSGHQVLGERNSPRCAVHLNHLPGPSCLGSWVYHESAISGVLGVSSGELISGCDPPGGCQPSRIPGRLG